MPKVLYLFDVSPFIHAGHVNKYSRLEQVVDTGSTWKSLVTPTGGTSLIFNKLYEVTGRGDIVFCCDRNPTIKKDMIPGYKNDREHSHAIEVEKAAAEYILQQCGFTVIARSGYEADDIIYSLVKQQWKAYDEIYIYTGDSDLYFLVDEKVSILPSSSRSKEVTINNYNEVLRKYGVVYNTMTMHKIIKGDAADKIPALPKSLQKKLENFFYLDTMVSRLGDKKFVKDWCEYLFPDAVEQVDKVFPLFIEDLPKDFKEPDISMVMNFGAAIHNKMFRGRGSSSFDIQWHIEEMQNRGYYLEDD